MGEVVKQVVSSPDGVKVVDVPAPGLEPGTVLVRTAFSCVSPGTELAGVSAAEIPLWRRVARDPRKAWQRASSLASAGLGLARREVDAIRNQVSPMGYSASGVVVQVADDVVGIAPGDRVACAGAGIANHAELIRVPVNLVALVPEGVTLEAASMTTLGSIALQGVRRFEPTLGETVAVVGLGVLGQLTVELLLANGCGVVAIDLDAGRVERARSRGALGVQPGAEDTIDRVSVLTRGVGVDGVIITASSGTSELISEAFRMTRSRGRVVVVGDVGLDLRREDMYERELELRMSTSYGPGRYDRAYEADGLDYPIGQVRWTENRNMQAVLELVDRRSIDVEALVGAVHDLDAAHAAFAQLRDPDGPRPLTVLLRYPTGDQALASSTIVIRSAGRTSRGRLSVGVIGAGSFATSVHLPNLVARSDVRLRSVAGRTPTSIDNVGRRFGADLVTTDPAEVIDDPLVDAIVICTRHDSHAELALRALEAGKHVLLEKPLATTPEQLDLLEAWVGSHPEGPVLMTGFNRRFSPAAKAVRRSLSGRNSPIVLTYAMNAGYLPSDHWVHGPEGGGRNIGEACHVYDLLGWLVGERTVTVEASDARPGSSRYRSDDNFAVSIRYVDGSLGSIVYTSFGDARWPKEHLIAYVEGTVVELDDYRSVRTSVGAELWASDVADKGHAEELEAFVLAASSGGTWPVPFEEQVEATRTSFTVDALLRGGTTEP